MGSGHSQQPDECGTGQRQTKRVCVCVCRKSVSSCLWREDGGKTAWLQFPAKTGKQLLEGGGKRGKDREGGRRGGLSVKHAQSLSQAVENPHSPSPMHWLGPSTRRWKEMWTNTQTVLPHLQINSAFQQVCTCCTGASISTLLCWTGQRPLGQLKKYVDPLGP